MASGLGVWGSGFRVEESRILVLGFGIWGLEV